jgi:3-phenylpropionate/trans-cinnamate dioxygenase ferredoxin subunit
MSNHVLTLMPFNELDVDSAVRVDVEGHRLAVIRIADDVYVLGDECSHADYSLSEGEVDSDEMTIECWKHGSTFGLSDGQPTCLPATKPVPVYEASVVAGNVTVTVTAEEPS